MKNEKKYTAPEVSELKVSAADIIATSSVLFNPDILAGAAAYKSDWKTSEDSASLMFGY